MRVLAQRKGPAKLCRVRWWLQQVHVQPLCSLYLVRRYGTRLWAAQYLWLHALQQLGMQVKMDRMHVTSGAAAPWNATAYTFL